MADIMEKVGKYGPYVLGAGFTGAAGAGIVENQRKLNEDKKEQDMKRMREAEAKDKEPTGSGKESLSKERSYKKGGSVSSASKRADGCCIKGKTKGRMV